MKKNILNEKEMNLSVIDLVVILDTLYGSLKIKDYLPTFKYTPEAREEVMNRLYHQAKEMKLKVEFEN